MCWVGVFGFAGRALDSTVGWSSVAPALCVRCLLGSEVELEVCVDSMILSLIFKDEYSLSFLLLCVIPEN